MPAIAAASIAFVLIFGSTLFGMFIRSRVPDHHLAGDSKDVIRLATALIATMSAVVLALLFASTRGSFEQTSATVTRLTADIIELDHVLDDYGPEATPLRKALRSSITPMIDSIWREDIDKAKVGQASLRSESVLYGVRTLVPSNPVQASLQARALQLSTDISQIRLILFTQLADSISRPFMTALVLWLSFIFGSFAVSAPPNRTIVTVLFVCVFSASTAIFLILELGQPFDGLMQIPNIGLRDALAPLPGR
ncbi:MAG: bestrophin-like domain [Reyranella sp.]